MTRIPLTLTLFALSIGVALLAAFAVSLSSPPTFLSLAHAQASPSVAIDLSPSTSVTEGTAITVTMSFGNLAEDSDRATTDYTFRADVLDADGCEEQAGGYGLGVDRKINQVDEDPETRAGTISAGCPAGDYTVRASISDADGGELVSATADFSVVAPEPPASSDAALSSLALSGVTLEFDPATTTYTAEVGNDLAETTVTPTVNDDGATYVVRLDGAADEDGTVPLAVGENVISVVVTAEDGETTRTYTVTVTRAETPMERSTDAALSSLALSGVTLAFDSATTAYAGEVGNDLAETTVTPTVNDDGATYAVRLDGAADDDGIIPLAVGENTISILVTAEDDETTRTYTVTVTRAEAPPERSTDAALSSLTLSGVTLEFDPVTTTYTAEVGNDLAETTVTPTVNDDGATYTVKLDGAADGDGIIPLAVGENAITVVVTAEDGDTTKTYTVTVTRAEAPTSGPTVAIALSPSDTMIEGEGTEIAVTLSFGNLTFDDDRATTDYTFRADVKDSEDGDADECEEQAGGYGLGVDRKINLVDEDPEVRRGAISADCPPGAYNLTATISAAGVELASATAAFSVLPPPTAVFVGEPVEEEPVSAFSKHDDATLSALTVSPTDINGFASDNEGPYRVGVANTVTQVTITPTSNNATATIDIGGTAVTSGTGHQITLAEGLNTVTITVTAQDGDHDEDYTIYVGRGVTTHQGWKAADDFNGLTAAANDDSGGIWGNATTMWVSDSTDDKLYAYDMTTKARDGTKDITLDATDNTFAGGIWSDGTTMYVLDKINHKIYAYHLLDDAMTTGVDEFGTRDEDKDITLDSSNTGGGDIWSDGTTMWVVDGSGRKVYAYTLADGVRDESEEFETGETDIARKPHGIWGNANAIWLGAIGYTTTRARRPHTLTGFLPGTKARAPTWDFHTLEAAGINEKFETLALWSDGTTLWVLARRLDKIYSFNLPTRASSSDATLSNIVTAPVGISGFDSDLGYYHVGHTSDTESMTVTATATDSNATIRYSGGVSSGQLPSGTSYMHTLHDETGPRDNALSIHVTAEDSVTRKTYHIYAGRGSTDLFKWKVIDDFNTLNAAGFTPETSHLTFYTGYGITSNGTTMWAASKADTKLLAFNMSDKMHNASNDIDLHADNENPGALWSNATTIWVVDTADSKLYAYDIATRERSTTLELNLVDQPLPGGIWSNGSTMWVANRSPSTIYAYDLTTKARKPSEDFLNLDRRNRNPIGIYSNGETMWVVDYSQNKLFAYDLTTKARDEVRDFVFRRTVGQPPCYSCPGLINKPKGLWGNGQTIWVSNAVQILQPERLAYSKIYSFNMPAVGQALPNDAFLSTLTVSPKDIYGFRSDITDYHVGVASSVNEITITATVRNAAATIDIDGTAVTSGTGHQFSLSEGLTTSTVTVTASDGVHTKTFTINAGRGVDTAFGWKASDDINGLVVEGNDRPEGIWSDGTTVWVSDSGDDKLYAYNLATKERDASKEFDLVTDNRIPSDIWSDSTTMWVLDSFDNHIYAYHLVDDPATVDVNEYGTGDSAKDIDLTVFFSGGPFTSPERRGWTGIWADGTTMWVANANTGVAKIFAYNLSTATIDTDKYITLDTSNEFPTEIWANETTMWVAENRDFDFFDPGRESKLLAYDRETGTLDASKHFNDLVENKPLGLWSDGTTMWVVNLTAPVKIYSYNMPVEVPDTAALPIITSRDGHDVGGPFTVRFNFLEASNPIEAKPVTEFVLGDIGVTNGTASALIKVGASKFDGAIWEATITPDSYGTVVVLSLAANAVAEGNEPTALAVTTRVDNAAPTVTMTLNSASLHFDQPRGLYIKFNERVKGLDITDFTVDNGEIGYVGVDADGNGHAVLVPKIPENAQPNDKGIITVPVTVSLAANAVRDLKGLGNAATTIVVWASPDKTPPEIVGFKQRLRRVDEGTGTHVWALTFAFSEPVTGFGADDLVISSNGTKSDESRANHAYGTRWAIDIESDGGQTPITVSVAAGAFSDGNNNNTKAFSGEIDRSVPPPASDD